MHALGKVPKYRNTMKKGHTGQFYKDLLKIQKVVDMNMTRRQSSSPNDEMNSTPMFQGIILSRVLTEDERAYALRRSFRD